MPYFSGELNLNIKENEYMSVKFENDTEILIINL